MGYVYTQRPKHGILKKPYHGVLTYSMYMSMSAFMQTQQNLLVCFFTKAILDIFEYSLIALNPVY